MQLVKLSATHGLNLGAVTEWQDFPDMREPHTYVAFSAPSEYESDQRHFTQLYGPEREAFLRLIESEAVEVPPPDPRPFGTHVYGAQRHLQGMIDHWSVAVDNVCLAGDGERLLATVKSLDHMLEKLRLRGGCTVA